MKEQKKKQNRLNFEYNKKRSYQLNYLKIYGSAKIRHKIFVPSNSHPLKAQSTKKFANERESTSREEVS